MQFDIYIGDIQRLWLPKSGLFMVELDLRRLGVGPRTFLISDHFLIDINAFYGIFNKCGEMAELVMAPG